MMGIGFGYIEQPPDGHIATHHILQGEERGPLSTSIELRCYNSNSVMMVDRVNKQS